MKAQFQSPGAAGVVALHGGNISGYLISQIGQGAAWIGYSSHAAVPEDGFEVYRSLYASLAPRWMAAGCVAQFVGVAAMDSQTLAAWYSLGFAQEMIRAVRATAPLVETDTVARVQIRRAGPDDSSVVGRLSAGLAEYESGPPIYGRPAPDIVADGSGYKWALADSRYAYWLAESDGRAVALLSLEPMPGFFGELVVPARCVFLGKAFVEADARGSGIATALLGQGLAWARSAGYEQCMLNFKPMNLLGARFWLGHGFRPLAYSMCRLVDQRIS